jgi:hypothetical protein
MMHLPFRAGVSAISSAKDAAAIPDGQGQNQVTSLAELHFVNRFLPAPKSTAAAALLFPTFFSSG